MSSFLIRPPLLSSDYRFKRKVHTDDNTVISNGSSAGSPVFNTMRMVNGLIERAWAGGRDDDRIGRIVDNMRFEFHWDIYGQQQQGSDPQNDQVLPTIVRHSIVWLNEAIETEDVLSKANEIFDITSSLDIHTTFNADNLASGDLIVFYDKTIKLSSALLANRVVNVGAAPEIEYFYVSYVPQGGLPVLDIEEGIIDLAKYYRGGLRTVFGSQAAHDIQSGILIDIWRTENNIDGVFLHGKYTIWYSDR